MIDYLFLKCDDGRHARHEVQVVLERSSEAEHSCFLDLWLDANDCGLVTASIALDYNREVFAFPGRVGDSRSEGCNRLIRLNRAGLITCAQDFIEAMNWDTSHCQKKSIQHSIPFEEENLTPNKRLIIDALRDRGDMLLSQL